MFSVKTCFPLNACHVSIETKTNGRSSKAAHLIPVLWHSDIVKSEREQERQTLQTFQN